jgi:hypothetical protein
MFFYKKKSMNELKLQSSILQKDKEERSVYVPGVMCGFEETKEVDWV